jgi:hypothetical protein
MKKSKLVLLDAGIVLELFSLGLWDRIIDRYEVVLSKIVAGEVRYYKDENLDRHGIDLAPFASDKRIRLVDLDASELKSFLDQFDPLYRDQLHDGESESLAFLMRSQDGLICAADAAVFRVLGRLDRSDQGISLEEVLQKVGENRKIGEWRFGKRFREKYTQLGVADRVKGTGLRT